MEKHFDSKNDGTLHFMDQIWVLNLCDIKSLVLEEAHKTRYAVHPGSDKIYLNMKNSYWLPKVKAKIATYLRKCLTCAKVKAEYQNPSGLLKQPYITEWKWEKIDIDFITKLPKTLSGYDIIWVVISRMNKFPYFLSIKEMDKMEKLAKTYIKELFRCMAYRHLLSQIEIADLHLGPGK